MRVKIAYKGDKSYGIDYSEKFYKAEVGWCMEGARIKFDFPKPANGVGEDSKIERVSLDLTKQEAEEIIAALHSYLHHPEIKEQSVKWLTYREMPTITENGVPEKLNWKWGEGEHSVSVENLSDFHISSARCLIIYVDSEETKKIRETVQLNIAPKEFKDISFELPKGSKISSIKIEILNGYKIK